jgi:hypothetical protein
LRNFLKSLWWSLGEFKNGFSGFDLSRAVTFSPLEAAYAASQAQ